MKTVAPTAADIENLALQAFDALPDVLRAEVGEIVFRVEEYPDEESIPWNWNRASNYWVYTKVSTY